MTERELFVALLDLPHPADRAAYLDRACAGDPGLRAQVEALLQCHDGAGSFLGFPAVPPPDPDTVATANMGDDAPGDGMSFLAPSGLPGSFGRIGHYEVLGVIGRGGFGIVLRAFDETLHRVVAIKVLASALAAASPARQRFLREARSAAKIRHENVVQVYAVEEQPLPYLVMEYIPGETLQQRIDRAGPLDLPEVVRLGRQIAEGLAAAHATGLIHRDIKPANLLIEAGTPPRVKITDFGLARAADDASLTQTGLVAGTPMYMSPEQARGDPLDPRADLFSLGSVMYVMATGRPPFRAATTFGVLKRVAEDTPRPIPEIIPEVPAWMCEVIARLHAKGPCHRFASAREVADLLARHEADLLHPGPAASPASGGSPPAPAWGPGRWIAAAAVPLLALAILGASEATGVTDVRRTVVRLFTPHGTLVIEVDDPAVSVSVEGEDVVITGAGVKEIRLRAGKYKVKASKGGKTLREELVTVERDGRPVVRVTQEGPPAGPKGATDRGKSRAAPLTDAELARIASLPAQEQVQAVLAQIKQLNPGFDGPVESDVADGQVVEFRVTGRGLEDLSPLRAWPRLSRVTSYGQVPTLTDLTPLRGLPLTRIAFHNSAISDLTPLRGTRLCDLDLAGANGLKDLTPLRGVPLVSLNVSNSLVDDLSPLRGMKLTFLGLAGTRVSDLSPVKGMPLERVYLVDTAVSDLTPLAGTPLAALDVANTRVADLTPLKGISGLKELYLQSTKVSDLTPLKGLPLTDVNCSHTAVTDLSPLAGMKLTALFCDGTRAPDLTALKGMPLKQLNCRGYDLKSPVNRAVLRSLTTLEIINSKPPNEFWKDLEADLR